MRDGVHPEGLLVAIPRKHGTYLCCGSRAPTGWRCMAIRLMETDKRSWIQRCQMLGDSRLRKNKAWLLVLPGFPTT